MSRRKSTARHCTLQVDGQEATVEVRVLRSGALNRALAQQVVDTIAELAADVCDAVVDWTVA